MSTNNTQGSQRIRLLTQYRIIIKISIKIESVLQFARYYFWKIQIFLNKPIDHMNSISTNNGIISTKFRLNHSRIAQALFRCPQILLTNCRRNIKDANSELLPGNPLGSGN